VESHKTDGQQQDDNEMEMACHDYTRRVYHTPTGRPRHSSSSRVTSKSPQSGYGSRRPNMTHKNRKKLLQFLIKKDKYFLQLLRYFFLLFLVIKSLDPDPGTNSLEMLYLDSMNPAPQH
jgi:hypothetical protein